MNEPNDEQSNSTQTALVKCEERLDVVPTQIDFKTLVDSGHGKNYLLRKCEQYDITLGDLRYMIDLKKKYETNLPTLIKLVQKGYSLDEVEEMFELRTETKRERDLLSLESICKFQDRFGLPVDRACLADSIYRLVEVIDEMYNYKFSKRADPSDRAIKLAIKLADDFEFINIGSVIDYLENPESVHEVLLGGAICEDYSEDSFP